MPEHTEFLPVRMLNEYAYCPRLYHLMHIDGEWADNAFTEDGKKTHKRVDRVEQILPEAGDAADSEGEAAPEISRSVSLGCEILGINGKLDLVSTAGDEALPVETKRGTVPNNEQRSWEPERVQLMAQGLLLRAHGYRCDHGVLYFAGSRTRVQVPFTDELEIITRQYITAAHAAQTNDVMPLPLDNSPKCKGCSLVGICLPDETLALHHIPPDPEAPEIRRLYPARDDALPLYVQEQGAFIGKKGKSLVIKKSGVVLATAKLKDTSHLVIHGNVQISTQTTHLLCEAGIPTVHLSTGGWFYGITSGITYKNGYDRSKQYACAADPAKKLILAKAFISAKTINQRTMLRRNARPGDQVLFNMKRIHDSIDKVDSPDVLLGKEGSIAAIYFEHFSKMVKDESFAHAFDAEGRSRRPPPDPVNSLLSYGYALLAKECTVALLSVNLDPYWGFFHTPRHGRPALALDLMEEFRPLIVDSAVINALNTGMLKHSNFKSNATSCLMNPSGRKAFITAYEARLDQLVTHPLFEYRCSWRRIIHIQARMLARYLRGDIPTYTGMTTR